MFERLAIISMFLKYQACVSHGAIYIVCFSCLFGGDGKILKFKMVVFVGILGFAKYEKERIIPSEWDTFRGHYRTALKILFGWL